MAIANPTITGTKGLARLSLVFLLPSLVIAQTAQPRETIITSSFVPDAAEVEFLERYCFDEVNSERKKHLLSSLVFSEHLLAIARRHSRRMAEEGFFSHTDPEGRSIVERSKEEGVKFTVIAENLLSIKGYVNPVPAAIERWMSSDGHRGNMLNPEFTYAAVGVWIGRDGTVYFTEVFVR